MDAADVDAQGERNAKLVEEAVGETVDGASIVKDINIVAKTVMTDDWQ